MPLRAFFPLLTLLGVLTTFALPMPASAEEPEPAPAQEPAPRAVAPIDIASLPPELASWAPWVLTQHPDLACPLGAGDRACVWPGELEVIAGDTGARFRLQVHTDRHAVVILPGGKGAWPDEVQISRSRGTVPVLQASGRPVIELPPGTHTVAGKLRYSRRPASLPISPRVARVGLVLDGAAVPFPRIDSDGLRLGSVASEDREGEHLDVEVSRRIRDGVPLVVETVVSLRASGRGREVDFGPVTLEGARPVSLDANLPARFTAEGTLQVQVRPGTWSVRFESVHDGSVDSLSRRAPSGDWPDLETWAVQTDDRVRAVNLGGAVGVDPARTSLPEDWRALPAFRVAPDTPLTFETLRRGDPDPAPNHLRLLRNLWVDLDGQGLTIKDQFTGDMHQDWRLDTLAPLGLGHAAVDGDDVVITQGANGSPGVELRHRTVQLDAESRIDERARVLPAVGWDTDVVDLKATLHLPPGFSLLAGTGVDNISGSMVDRWTLFDLFFVLVLAMATFRLLGVPWGLAALVGLALARHEVATPQWTWAVVLALVALQRVVPEGWGRRLVQGLRLTAVLALLLILVPFAIDHVQTGLFPALDEPWNSGEGEVVQSTFQQERGVAYDSSVSTLDEARMKRSSGSAPKKFGFTKQVDPKAVVQTGPGVPRWTWRAAELTWSGPVSRDQTMRLYLIGPFANLLLALLRVGLLGALAVRLSGVRPPTGRTGPIIAAALLGALGLAAATPAVAAPDAATLDTLEKRLTAPPACAPDCVSISHASLQASGDQLRYRATVHAGVDASVPLPGPASVWVPAQVRLDGRVTHDLARFADGTLQVRLPAGSHVVEARGPLPPQDAVALAFGEVPHVLEWSGDGWAIDGLRADGSVDGSVQLTRMLGETSTAQSTENLAPWLEVRRHLDLGIPWRVQTTVVRVGPADYPVAVKVPLLPGEAVTEGGFDTADGQVSVSLDRDVREATWLSTLPTTPEVVLSAPREVPWTEVWTLSCSPVYACTTDGPAPLHHVASGQWAPVWRVWPGEQLTVTVARPAGVDGQTTTIDDAELRWRPGRRHLLATLDLTIRSSQGGRQAITLPEGAALQSVKLDGADRPLQLRDDRVLLVPLSPGSQHVEIQWQQARVAGLSNRLPPVELGGPAVNVHVVVETPTDRWIAALYGPRWGPVPLMWTYVVAVLVLAPLLGRIRNTPLATWQWALLGLGMTQVHVVAPMIVVGWFFALAARRAHPARNPMLFNGVQLALVLLTVAAVVGLYAAIHTGLLWQPDMQVAGGGSSDHQLRWFVDRIEGSVPRPTVVSLPIWTWRVVMLLWSLWLAASLVRWLPWAFESWTDAGWIRRPTLPAEPADDDTP